MRPAHPRAGEENREGNTRSQFVFGSSPRGRGKLSEVHHEVTPNRLIPARAGKTSGECSPAHQRWAHPRAGGENAKSWRAGMATSGSSPRGRGKPEVWSKGSLRWRLIPARAGKTQ